MHALSLAALQASLYLAPLPRRSSRARAVHIPRPRAPSVPAAAQRLGRWSLALAAVLLLNHVVAPAGSAQDVLTRLAEAVNTYRGQNGLARLTLQTQLSQAAQGHADYLAQSNTFNHYGANGTTHLDRVRAAGYRMCAATENIAMGAWDPDTIVRLWAGSSGHRANMLSDKYSELGVGRAQSRSGEVYWVLVEGKPCAAGETPPTFINVGGVSMPLGSWPSGSTPTSSNVFSGGTFGLGSYGGYAPYGSGGLGGSGFGYGGTLQGLGSYGLAGYGTGSYGTGGYGTGGYGTGGYGTGGYGFGGYPYGSYGYGGYGAGGYAPGGYGWPGASLYGGYGSGYAPSWSYGYWGPGR